MPKKRSKVQRFLHPKCADDYGLSVTTKELSRSKEGRMVLAEFAECLKEQKPMYEKGRVLS